MFDLRAAFSTVYFKRSEYLKKLSFFNFEKANKSWFSLVVRYYFQIFLGRFYEIKGDDKELKVEELPFLPFCFLNFQALKKGCHHQDFSELCYDFSSILYVVQRIEKPGLERK